MFNAPISDGGIRFILNKFVAKARPAYDLINARLVSDPKHAVGSNETGIKANGDKHLNKIF